VIAPWLFERLACPVCLEAEGCESCRRPKPGPADYAARLRCPCGGPEKVRLVEETDALRCPACGNAYPVRRDAGYVDLVPRESVGEVTQYADHEFHERMHVTDAPPVLSARVKADMMRRMLAPGPGEVVLDLGCGPGKLALFAGTDGARPAGLDVAPFFLPRAAREVALVLGDLRRLPFRKAAFPRAYSLDVLEHLDEPDLADVLVEARRAIGSAGALFVYTHAMETGWLRPFQHGVKRLARRLGQAGLLDYEREALRKSDHKNAIRSHEHFDALCREAGLAVAERRYYNVFFKAMIEDLLFKIYDHARTRGRNGSSHHHDHDVHAAAAPDTAAAAPPPRAIGAPAPRKSVLWIAEALTWLLKLDVVLFSGIRTGPFFALLRPARPGADAAVRSPG
jgi:ubiquinone/menaquinone biosynthesis C-methylase UbiE